MIIESLQQITPHSRPGTPRDGMTHYKSLQRIGIVAFPINHVQYLFVMLFALSEARGPIIACPASVFGDENIFFVEEIAVWALAGEFIYYAGFEIY